MTERQRLAEGRLLNIAIKYPSTTELINSDCFYDDELQCLYKAVESLVRSHQPVSDAGILQEAGSTKLAKQLSLVEALETFDEQPSKDVIIALKKTIRSEHAKESALSIVKKTESLLQSDASLKDIRAELDKSITALSVDVIDEDKKAMTLSTALDKYERIFDERKNGKQYKFYDATLDELSAKGPVPGAGTIITASSGSGKSAYVMHLVNGFIDNHVPCMMYSLEMSLEDVIDRYIAAKTNIPLKTITDPRKQTNDFEMVKENIESLKKSVADCRLFRFNDAATLDFSTLDKEVRRFYADEDIHNCIVVIDLLSMMKEFTKTTAGVNSATAMEFAVNILNAMSKELNFHWIGVLQQNRTSEDAHLTSIDDVYKFRPTRTGIKNSNAYLERARMVVALFRPKFWFETYLPDRKEEWQDLDDIVEVHVLKQNNGMTGMGKMLFDGSTMKFTPLIDTDEED